MVTRRYQADFSLPNGRGSAQRRVHLCQTHKTFCDALHNQCDRTRGEHQCNGASSMGEAGTLHACPCCQQIDRAPNHRSAILSMVAVGELARALMARADDLLFMLERVGDVFDRQPFAEVG